MRKENIGKKKYLLTLRKWGGSMRAVLLIALNNIKKKKLQNVLIMLIMLTAAVLFSSALNFVLSVDKPFSETHKKLHGFDNIFYVSPDSSDNKKIIETFKNNSDVNMIDVKKAYNSLEYPKVNGKQMKQALRLEEKDNKNEGVDRLITLSGDNGKSPKDGEVWLSKGIADDNSIKLYDNIEFNIDGKVYKEKIGAIVVDPNLGEATVGIARFFINKNELLKTVPKDKLVNAISIEFKKCGDGDDANLKIENELGRPINGSCIKYSQISEGSTMLYKIIGIILLAVALFILLFTFLIIMITIANAIANDYKNIGITESLGFTKKDTMLQYIFQFLVLAVISSLIGVIMGSVLSGKVLGDFYLNMGFNKVNMNFVFTSILTVIFILSFVFIFSSIASLKILKVSPVEAIREGNAPTCKKDRNTVSIMSMKKINMFLSLGIKNILGNFKQSFLMFIAICAVIFITSFCINASSVLKNAYLNSSDWGFEKSDLSLTVNSGVTAGKVSLDENNMKKDNRLLSVTSAYYYSLITMPKTDKLPSKHLYTFVYDNDFNKAGLINIKGRNPKKNDEISVAVKLSKEYNKDVGDYITLYINGNRKTFLITGVYQNIIHAGESIRVPYDTIIKEDPSFKDTPSQITVIVKDKSKVNEIIKSLKNEYGSRYKVEIGNKMFKNIGQLSFQVAVKALFGIAICFIIISVFCIFNLNLINIYSCKKELGIYKAIGMTNTEINKIYIFKLILIILIAIIITIPLGMLTHGPIFNLILSFTGITKLKVPMCFSYVFCACTLFTVLTLISLIISCRAISSINGRELISE